MFFLQKLVAICTLSVCIATNTGELNDTNATEKLCRCESKPTNDECSRPECIHEASRILRNMDDRVEPCDDFHKFVCGNYANPAFEFYQNSMAYPPAIGQLEVDSRLRAILEDIDESTGLKVVADLKNSYTNCMEDEWKDESASELTETVDTWRSLFENPLNTTQSKYSSVHSYLFDFNEKLDATNTTNRVLQLSIKAPPIPWGYLEKGESNDVVKAYFLFMTDVIGHLRVNSSTEVPNLLEVLSIEIELSKIVFPENVNYDFKRQYTRTTLGELKRKYPNLHLNESSDRDDDTVVQMRIDVDLIGSLDEWISRKSRASLATWVTWRWTADRVDQLGSYFVHKLKKLQKTVFGYVREETKWRSCVRQVHSEFPLILDLLYYGQYLSENVVRDSTEIGENITQAFTGLIEKTDWLDATTKQHALDKVKSIKNNFGVYERFMVDGKSNPPLIDWKLSNGLLADNRIDVLQLLMYSYIQSQAPNSAGKNSGNWNFVETVANFYQELVFLRVGAITYTHVFYNADRPKALNYGAFGSLVGHELGHSLDDTNRHADKNGNFNPSWDSQSNETFVEKIKCLVEQYRKYGSDELGLRLSSFKTRNEDIADNVGVKAAYFAYDKWAKENGPEKKLPGLDYTPRQLFWIGFASTECSKFHPQFSKTFLLVDDHSPEKLRINIPVSNMPEFAKDFKCKKGSKMNPVKRCVVW